LVQGYDFVDGDTDPSEVGAPYVNPAYGHGTHVSGIIALVAPEARIMPIRVLDENGEGDFWRIAEAIVWAANHGADVVNISFGYPQQTQLLRDLLDACSDGTTTTGKTFPEIGINRLFFSIAAGNSGDSTFIYPAADADDSNGSLAIGASTRFDRLAQFSTFHNRVKLVAPGENIVSAIPGDRYAFWSGTSMAAPIVSAVAALVKARYPNLNPVEIAERVEQTSVRISYGNPQIRINRVDALCAVTLIPPATCNP